VEKPIFTNGLEEQEEEYKKNSYKKQVLQELKFAENQCINAFETLSSTRILKLAYSTIKSKAGNMTRGIDKTTLDGINDEWFMRTSKALRNESYEFKPVRKVLIPKPNGKKRPLGVGSPRDKIIQQAMRLVMEAVLEPKFENTSHGFRPNRGCHTALREVHSWKGVNWFLEGDISNYFPTINHNLAATLIAKHFKEKRLVHLFWKMARAGQVELVGKKKIFSETEMGVPQGSIISPLVSNLVLDELDKFIQNRINSLNFVNRGIPSFEANPQYKKISAKIINLKKKINRLKAQGLDWSESKLLYIKCLKERRRTRSTRPTPNYMKIEYVRYADDWLIGVWGSYKQTRELKNVIKSFLKTLKLELSEEKTKITHAIKSEAEFLGTTISRRGYEKFRTVKSNRVLKRRSSDGHILLKVPIKKLVKKLVDKKFLELKNEGRWNPLSRAYLAPLPDRDIILNYQSILRGITNYYSFAVNSRQLARIYWILKESLRKTLARKHDIGYREGLKKYGNNISIKFLRKDGKTIILDFACPNLAPRVTDFKGSKLRDPLEFLHRELRTKNSFGLPCSSCNSTQDIEMHHVKHIKTINVKLNSFDQLMAKINRKQVPLCSKCHKDIHAGKYDGKSLKFLTRSTKQKTRMLPDQKKNV
jgi:group II intron reverse transcriptase/maturase